MCIFQSGALFMGGAISFFLVSHHISTLNYQRQHFQLWGGGTVPFGHVLETGALLPGGTIL